MHIDSPFPENSPIPLHTWGSQTKDIPQHNILLPPGCLLHDHEVTTGVDVLDLLVQKGTEERTPKNFKLQIRSKWKLTHFTYH